MKARPWVRAARLGAALLALATVLSTGRAEAAPPRSAHQPVPATPAAATIRQVTLITGDRVVVSVQGKQATLVDIVPGPGRRHISFAALSAGGRLRVMPADAMPLIRANRLDPRLFDVTALVRFGYDDRRKDLPVLMLGPATTAASATTARAQARTDAKAAPMRNVPGGAAFRVAKKSSAEFWHAFTASAGGATRPGAPAPKLWLDAIHRLSLKDSVPQIGAPTAWAAGFTGAGVIVGVVDSGIDSTHPDLAGRVIAAQDFTDDNDTRDLIGHGTHVAATIASVDSVYRGVAPDAHLVSAKACNDNGCPDSTLLAAIQYAIDNGAKIINMSLGGTDTTDIDPLEADINQLTAQDGVLFVVAAGNDGASATINSPGSADAAMTVGAVDKSDQLAFFSSMGPRLGDDAIKPDITAPGVDITAARSQDGQFGNPGDLRVALSGTSMATPHVAGSAAILLQEHPTWTPARLKAALMGSALRNGSLNPFEQGAGRVDVAHEIVQTVLADPPSVSFATEIFPHGDDTPDGRTVTYHNVSASPVTLQLSLAGSAPAGMFSVSASSVTVPANGDASVTLTANTNLDVPDDHYTGYLMAQAPNGTVSTPFAVFKAPESHAVTFRYLDRSGRPTDDAFAALIDPDTGALIEAPPGDGQTLNIPKATYAVFAAVFEDDGSTSLLLEPAVTIDTDRDMVFDARKAKPVTITVPFAGAQQDLLAAAGQIDTPLGPAVPIAASFDGTPIYLGSADPSVTAPYAHSMLYERLLVPPRAGADPTDNVQLSYHTAGRLFDGLTRHVKRSDLATFPVQYPTDGHSDVLLATEPVWPDFESPISPGVDVVLPTQRTEYLNTNESVAWRRSLFVFDAAGNDDYILFAPLQTFQGGQTYAERRNAPVFGPGFRVPAPGTFYLPPISRQGDSLNVIPTVTNDRLNWLGVGQADTGPATLTLSRNGAVLASDPSGFSLDVDVPPGEASYRVSLDKSRVGADTVSTSIHVDWTFHSDTTATTSFAAIPLPAVRFAPDLSLTDTAPAGRALVVPVEIQNEPTAPASAVRSLTVQVSYDDGATWHNVVVTGVGAHRVAVIPSPRSGFVSLRASATNTAGNSVSETIIRAYGVA